MRWLDELQRMATTADTAMLAREQRKLADVRHLLPRARPPDPGDPQPRRSDEQLRGGALPRRAHQGCPARRAGEREPHRARGRACLAGAAGRGDRVPGRGPGRRSRVGRPAPDPLGLLSARELDVLTLAAEGCDNDAIAARLTLSVRTVERHLQNVYAKLGLQGRSARTAAVAALLSRASDATRRPPRACRSSRWEWVLARKPRTPRRAPRFGATSHPRSTPMSTTTRRPEDQHRAMWALGDYPAVATEVIAPLGDVLVDACGIQSGQRVLDVAAGSGNAAIPAARRVPTSRPRTSRPSCSTSGSAPPRRTASPSSGRSPTPRTCRARTASTTPPSRSSASCSPRTTRPRPTSSSASSVRAGPSA